MQHNIGTTIYNLRQRHDWTQSQLARQLRTSVKTIKNWESGISHPSAEHIIQLCKLFSVTSDYLLGLTSEHLPDISCLNPSDRRKLNAIVQAFIDTCKYPQT